MKKKIFSFLLVLAMVVAMMPITALADTYTITYHYNAPIDSVFEKEYLPHNYTEINEVTIRTISRESFNFDGWFDNEALTGTPVTKFGPGATGDKEFWAKWTGRYTVKFDLNGGKGTIADITGLGIGDKIPAVSSPTYPGHIFKGWTCKGLDGYWNFDSTIITGDNQEKEVVTLIADWEDGYIVNFDVDGGKPALNSVTVAKNSKINKPETVTKSGYELKCWVDKDGKEWDFANDTVTADMTLYAKWNEKVSPEPESKPDAPKTEDSNNMIAWVMVLMLGLIGFVSTIIYKTKKQK